MKRITTLALLAIAACDLDVPDLNNPGIGDLEDNPTAAGVSSACTGLIIGNRRNTAQANGYVAQLGILGREAYNFDQADPRFIGELLQGSLNRGSPFGGNFWREPYANIRLANVILHAVDKVDTFSDKERSAIKGFTFTIEALDLLEVIDTHDMNGAVIDTDRPIDSLGPIADKAAVFAAIAKLLDDAVPALDGGGDAFPFSLSSGYEGFDEPATFKTFNRAIRARVAAYTKDYAAANTALAASFVDPMKPFSLGVFHTYGTGAGDQVNNLINPNIFAHPSLVTDAQMNGATKDTRMTSKIDMAEDPGSAQGLTSDKVFTIYSGPGSSVPVIRNEELLLLRAEARWFTNDKVNAMLDLNAVRTAAGLAALAPPATDTAFEDALLYERRYSLMFEGGHRWIDLRRFGRDLPLDKPDHTRNTLYPIPLAECNARPDEPKCQ